MRELNTQPTDCFICRKHRGEIVIPGGAIHEDDLLYAGHVGTQEGQAAYLGYIMVETKRHAPGLADLTDVESQAVGLLVARLSRALRDSEKAEHIYAFVIGDGVSHFHIHVIPRYPGAPREYWGVHGYAHIWRLKLDCVRATWHDGLPATLQARGLSPSVVPKTGN